MGEALTSAPDVDLPKVLRLKLSFTDIDLQLLCSRESFLQRVEARIGTLFDSVFEEEPCFIAVIRRKRTALYCLSFADLIPDQVRELGRMMEGETPGSFEELLAAAIDPETADTVQSKQLHCWKPEELQEVLATAQSISLQTNADALTYLEQVLDRRVDRSRLSLQVASER